MHFFPDSKTFVEVAGLSIQWYALTMMSGGVAAFLLGRKKFIKLGVTSDEISDYFMMTFLCGIIGARIWYVVFMFEQYQDNLFDIFKIQNGGLAIQGGIVAGFIYSYYFFKKRNIPILQAGDIIMPLILLSQAIGRWGNFINQEAHGGIVERATLEAMMIPNFIIEGMNIGGTYYHPTFLYESVLNLLGFILIYIILKKFNLKQGVLFFSYFIWYGITRFIVEGMRTDSLYFMGLRTAQLTSIAFVIGGIIGIIYLYTKKNKKA